MQVFEGRYFHLNRKFLMLVGLWPYEMKMKRNVIRALVIILSIASSSPHLISAIMHHTNTDRFMQNIFSFITIVAMALKVLGLSITENHMIELYESIAQSWLAIRDENERKILYKYSARGRFLTIYYGVFVSMAACMVSCQQLIPKILDTINPLDKPRKMMLFMDGEFFVDRDTYFIEIFIADTLSCLIVCVVTIPSDAIYMVFSQHCCALYAIVRYRLSKLRGIGLDNSLTDDYSHSYDLLVHTIQLHQEALNFTSSISYAFSTCFLFYMPCYFITIPLGACGVLANLDNPLNLISYIAYLITLSLTLVTMCWPGQVILDEGLSLLEEALYCNEWYTTPIRTKKCLLIFMIRCSQPNILTAGGLVPICWETYSKIMKTAISYITVAASFR